MNSKLGWLVTFVALLTAGCSTTPLRTSGGFLSEAARNPEQHLGEWVSSAGSVTSVREANGATVFRVATPNYAYVFEVSYPGEIPGLEKDRDVSFLGGVSGAIDSGDAYAGKILAVDAIAVKPIGRKVVYRPGQQELVQSWLDRKLNVTLGGGVRLPQRMAPAAPAPVPAAPAPALRGSEDASALKALLKRWNASSGEVKAKLRDLLDRWSSLPDEEKALFLEWNGLSDEDKALFRQLVTDSGPR